MTITRKNKHSRMKTRKVSGYIGPLHKGDLTQFGYKAYNSSEKRHSSLKLAIGKYGALSVWRKINAIYVLSKNRNPELGAIYNNDRNWIMKQFKLTK